MEERSRILIVGATGYIGRRIVKASIALAHPTFILFRKEVVSDVEKVEMLLSFKKDGAKLVEASFDDHGSLVDAVKQVDVVISAIAGNHMRHQILQQLKLVEAIKEAGNIKRFVPSEFGMDPGLMEHAMAPGNIVFIDKLKVREAIEAAAIPHTYISANIFAGYLVGGLAQLGRVMPPSDKVFLYGDGNVKAIWVDEDDIGIYTIKAIDDPRTLNKTMYIRPPLNILSQKEVVEKWEQLSGKRLNKTYISVDDFLVGMEDQSYGEKIGISHFYQIFYRGDLYNFEIGPNGVEASELYPEVKYTTMDSFMERYL
uniref:Pinoresinol-lariciresinol reductase 3 n=1 Tax=Taiwania cryptomerioides TaxID=50187 RepID=A0A650FA47_TAICR|nr:pinoresinol-lariciresinol reductase 3 [Taiwania cryptomerioides]